jgi:hypothetical protein
LQEDVFEDTKHLVRSALDGYNVCVFAYGQTGSGKTFTIYGNEAMPGLTPRGVREMFAQIDRDAGKTSYSVRVQMLELYQVGGWFGFQGGANCQEGLRNKARMCGLSPQTTGAGRRGASVEKAQ